MALIYGVNPVLEALRGGRRPVERSSLYQPLRDTFDDAPPTALPREAPRRPAAAPRALRLGRIPWINCTPVTGAVDRGIVPVDAELVAGVDGRATPARIDPDSVTPDDGTPPPGRAAQLRGGLRR